MNNRWISIEEFSNKYIKKDTISLRTLQRYCKEGYVPARLIKTNWMVDLWAWEEMAEKFLNKDSDVEEISLEDSVVGEVGMSIVGSRWVRKRLL